MLNDDFRKFAGSNKLDGIGDVMDEMKLKPSQTVGIIRAPLTRHPDATMPGRCVECRRTVYLDPRAVLFAELRTHNYVFVCEECFAQQNLPTGHGLFKLKDEGG